MDFPPKYELSSFVLMGGRTSFISGSASHGLSVVVCVEASVIGSDSTTTTTTTTTTAGGRVLVFEPQEDGWRKRKGGERAAARERSDKCEERVHADR